MVVVRPIRLVRVVGRGASDSHLSPPLRFRGARPSSPYASSAVMPWALRGGVCVDPSSERLWLPGRLAGWGVLGMPKRGLRTKGKPWRLFSLAKSQGHLFNAPARRSRRIGKANQSRKFTPTLGWLVGKLCSVWYVISYVYLATFDPNGSWQLPGFLYIWPSSHPKPAIDRKAMRRSAVKVGQGTPPSTVGDFLSR